MSERKTQLSYGSWVNFFIPTIKKYKAVGVSSFEYSHIQPVLLHYKDNHLVLIDQTFEQLFSLFRMVIDNKEISFISLSVFILFLYLYSS